MLNSKCEPAADSVADASISPLPENSVAVDRWMGVVLLVIGALMLVETFSFKTFDWDPLGMAFWPRVLIVALAVISIWHIVVGNVGGAMEPITRRAILLLFGCFAYLGGLAYLGYFVMTPFMIFAAGLWLRPITARAAVFSAINAVFGTVLVYVVFELGMSVELPRGIWG